MKDRSDNPSSQEPNALTTAVSWQPEIETKKVKKERYLIRQYDTIYTFFYKIIFFKYRTRQIEATEANKEITHLN